MLPHCSTYNGCAKPPGRGNIDCSAFAPVRRTRHGAGGDQVYRGVQARRESFDTFANRCPSSQSPSEGGPSPSVRSIHVGSERASVVDHWHVLGGFDSEGNDLEWWLGAAISVFGGLPRVVLQRVASVSFGA